MTDPIIEKLKSLKPLLTEEMGMTRLRVFGSRVNNNVHEDSDIDLIVDFDKKPSLLTFIGYKQSLEDELNVPVDLLTEQSIDKYIKNKVLSEAIDVF